MLGTICQQHSYFLLAPLNP